MSTGLDTFDTSIEKTNKLLKSIESELGWEGRRHESYSALRSVLHALRDRLPLNDAVNLSAQLPLLLKGVFFDGWEPSEVPIKMNREDFLDRISNDLLFYEGDVTDVVSIVLSNIFETIDPLEANKVMNELPADLQELFLET